MCFSATASAVTGAVGLLTSALAARWSRRFAVFWLVVSGMQFIELAIHLTPEQCKTSQALALTLHLLLVGDLLLQPLVYAWFVASRSPDRAKLLYAHWLMSMALRG